MRFPILVVAAAFLMSACTSLQNQADIKKSLVQQDADIKARLQANRDAASNGRQRPIVRYLDRQFVSLTPVLSKPEPTAAQSPLLRCKVSIETVQPISMLEFAQTITRKCKVNIRVTPDALAAVANPLGTTAPTSATPGGVPGIATPFAQPQQSQQNPSQIGLIDLNYDGELPGLLDTAVSRWGVSWKVDGDKIKIYNVDTRVFRILAFNSDTDFKSDVVSGTTMVSGSSGSGGGNGSAGGTSGGIGGTTGSQQTTTVTTKLQIWNDIIDTVKGMKSAPGTVNPGRSIGTIVVTDNDDVLNRIDAYLANLNKLLEVQVTFNVDVISVELTDTDSLGLSFDALYSTLSGKYGFSLASQFTGATGGVSSTFSILKNSGSPWSGTDAVVKALSEQGQVGLRRAPSAATLNMQTVSVQSARQTGFIASSSNTSTPQVGSTQALNPGTVTTGLNMTLTPYVYEDGKMLVQFNINLSSLLNLRQITVGNAYAESPELNSPIVMSQKVRLNAGETLMLSGSDDDDSNSKLTGAGAPQNWLLGGGMNSQRHKTKILVLITPLVMQ